MQRCHAISLLFVAALSSPISAAAEEWGDLTGKVVIRFVAPPPAAGVINVQGQQIRDESLLVSPDGGLANVVLYVRTTGVPIHPALAASVPPHATLAFKDSTVRPRILPVWIGRQTVLFGNLDPVGYNPNVQPLGDQVANFLLRPNESEIYSPARQQQIPVPVGCTIKPWIRAYLLPRYNPYAAVTSTKGEFTLLKLPAQALEFQLWHEKYGYLDTLKQPKGRLMMQIKPGENDLGTILVER